MRRNILSLLLVLPITGLCAEPMTREQGDAILNELRAIRQELADLRKQGVAPPAPRPRQQTASVTTLGNPVLGDLDAPITLVEFTDYQCPFCRRFYSQTLPKLRRDYIDTGKLRLVVRDLPLAMHAEAKPAARATHCAGEQDEFWAMHDALLNAEQLKQGNILAIARELGLNDHALSQCLKSDRYREDVERDMADANAAAITGTPSFVIGRTTDNLVEGKLIRGAQPYASFQAEIDRLLGE